MRIVTWNCQGAFRKKAEPIGQFAPDIAIIQESEPPEKLLFANGISRPAAHLWFGDYPSKGVGVFSYTGAQLEVHEGYDPTIRHCAPIRVNGRFRFNLIAVWAMNHADRKLSYIGQVYRAVEAYREFIQQRDTLLIGDFNSNKQWDGIPRVGNHSSVVASLADEQIVSAYHEYFKEQHGEETQSTLYMQRKREKGYHVDYCFVPKAWMRRIKALSVGSHREWSKLSDHSPIFVEFNQ